MVTKKKRGGGLSLVSLKSPFKFLGKTYCKGCKKKCSGEVLRVKDFYFHNGCFNCKGCGGSLSSGGYFSKDRDYFCGPCYQSAYGTKCFSCGDYVEGEVVTALGMKSSRHPSIKAKKSPVKYLKIHTLKKLSNWDIK